MHKLSAQLQAKYRWTGWFYDLLDYPWEREYRLWRKKILSNVYGNVLELGVGTGRNFIHYPKDIKLTGVDLSPTMLAIAQKRAKKARCQITLLQSDATTLSNIADNTYDWVISTFLCCVLPDALQLPVMNEFIRVLKPNGQFKLLEMVYSKDPQKRQFQEKISPLVAKIYGARFDRPTLSLVKQHQALTDIKTQFLKDDTYLLITGKKR